MPWANKSVEEGWVYVVTASNGFVKIGSTNLPFSRFSIIQSHSPLLLRLSYICYCKHPDLIERAAHEALASSRSHREWFILATEKAIETLRAEIRKNGAELFSIPDRRGPAGVVLRSDICESAVARVNEITTVIPHYAYLDAARPKPSA